jgi:hypothetical protein
MFTYLGEVAMIINTTRLHADPETMTVSINGKEVKKRDERVLLQRGSPYYIKVSKDDILFVKAPGFTIALKRVLSDHGKPLKHFDHAVSLGDKSERHDPHGLLGQTVHFDKPVVAKGHQGEGVIEGTITDYEIPTLWTRDFKFTRFNTQ